MTVLNILLDYIYAKKASGSIAQLLFYRLRRMGIHVSILPLAGSEIVEGLSLIEKEDLVILFGFSKMSKEARLILDYKQEIGYKIITFTGRNHLPKEE